LNRQPRKFDWLIWSGFGLALATLLLLILLAALKFRLAMGKPLPVYGEIADFNLTNQLGEPISLANLRGHVWVGDIIFTRCPGPCLKMTKQMKQLQDTLSPKSTTRLVSLTTDPGYDTPPVLATYGQRFNADPRRWLFLTGTKTEIAHLATDSLKLSALEKKPAEQDSAQDLFIHSTTFVLVDKRARLRGVFQTTGEDIDPANAKKAILAGIRRLELEK
jgi:protein SCO1/2